MNPRVERLRKALEPRVKKGLDRAEEWALIKALELEGRARAYLNERHDGMSYRKLDAFLKNGHEWQRQDGTCITSTVEGQLAISHFLGLLPVGDINKLHELEAERKKRSPSPFSPKLENRVKQELPEDFKRVYVFPEDRALVNPAAAAAEHGEPITGSGSTALPPKSKKPKKKKKKSKKSGKKKGA